MIIADTNIVSEFMKDTPDPRAREWAWAQSLGAADLTISVVTVEEIDRGLGRLPKGRRRKDLERRWTRVVDAFADTIATYDVRPPEPPPDSWSTAWIKDDRCRWPTHRSQESASHTRLPWPPETSRTSPA
ncbi:MAG: PIN domain-containing protein [Propionicimonas sp.]